VIVTQMVAGIDWAKDAHRVCVLDGEGRRRAEATVAHDEPGLAELVRLLHRHAVARVGIERPDGIVVDALAEAGISVLAIHPNQVKAARPRFRMAGKSDAFDAFLLAELARTDAHRFRALEPDGDETRALRALTRARADLVEARVGLANRLRAELERFWPGAAAIFAQVDSPIALAFLERYPAPADAARLGERRLGAFLERHGYCGRRRPAELLGRLRAAPAGRAGEAEAEARRGIVLGLVAALRPLLEQIRLLTSQIAGALAAHPDGEIFRSLFADPKSVVTAATLLAEIGDQRGRYADGGALAADAGVCPVAIESGRQRAAGFRWACDKRLRDALTTLADASRHRNPWAAERYRAARAAGKDHPHAARIVARGWALVIWRMWQDHMPYDPARHRALQRVLAAGG
jgi:transposase